MSRVRELVLVGNKLAYPEAPRWHEEKLWFNDIFSGELKTLNQNNQIKVIAKHDGLMSGIGWFSDNSLCIVSVFHHQLLRWKNNELKVWADIDDGNTFASNDMVVSQDDNSYVGNISFDYNKGETAAPCNIKMINSDGKMKIVATELQVPNGLVISSDGKTLITAESLADRLTAFEINVDGSLSNRRLWAQLPEGAMPDGICLDGEGCIWTACNHLRAVVRVSPNGNIIEKINVPDYPLACMLGGNDGKTLFILTTVTFDPVEAKKLLGGKIYQVNVDISHTGRP